MKETKDKIGIHGFSRVQIVDSEGEVAGDSGWVGPNQVVNLGFRYYLAELLGAMANSLQIGYMAIGTGSAPGAADTSLQGEQSKRKSVTAEQVSSKTLRCTATFGSSDSFVTATKDLSNIGLAALSAGGTIMAGNTYASSSCATNQNVNATYEIRFS